jgi:hypothetical protein
VVNSEERKVEQMEYQMIVVVRRTGEKGSLPNCMIKLDEWLESLLGSAENS